jgi:hypothetical protein
VRNTKIVSISLTPHELQEAEDLARATNRSLSGLFREGVQRLKIEQRWNDVNGYGRTNAKRLGIAQKDVVRLTKETRREIAAEGSSTNKHI